MFTLSSRASTQAAQCLGCDVLTYRWHLLTYQLQRDAARFLHGHFPCPPETIERFGDTTAFITILRHPVDRWISHYLYDRHKPGDYYRMAMSPAEYLQSELGRSNGHLYQSYFASRATKGDPVEQACRTLERFAIVALLEDLRTLTVPYSRLFGRALTISRERVNPAPTQALRELQEPTLRREIERICAPDIEIYEAARKLAEAGLDT